ncbi:MAG: hypothetical protein GF315_14800 [candidate division Zixibacteria bacterium]|nr:hypothetical protein [candidate division Zixibacteria bacterium]
MFKKLIGLLIVIGLFIAGCTQKQEQQTFTGMPDLVLTQAQFHDEEGEDGDTKSVPGAAKMTLVYLQQGKWGFEIVEDPQSNVFHKAIPFEGPGGMGLLTIGANAAMLKHWTRVDGKWTDTVLYENEFGGEQNRLRDIEIGDVTGDGKDDLVIATHDQGVVLVLRKVEGEWQAEEIDRQEKTFVHEIELGDVDNDGIYEIFATPSEPNKLDGTPQPGVIPMYDYENGVFIRSVVEEFPTRHVKEILCADIDDDGQPELYCAAEAEMAKIKEGAGATIKQYRFSGKKIVNQVVAELPDMLCRFLCAGDVDHDGDKEIVASPLRSGVWVLEHKNGNWSKKKIAENSSGFEHATLITDLNADGKNEIYVAADDQQVLRRITYNGTEYVVQDLIPIPEDNITFGVMPGKKAAYEHTEEMRL